MVTLRVRLCARANFERKSSCLARISSRTDHHFASSCHNAARSRSNYSIASSVSFDCSVWFDDIDSPSFLPGISHCGPGSRTNDFVGRMRSRYQDTTVVYDVLVSNDIIVLWINYVVLSKPTSMPGVDRRMTRDTVS